MTSTPAQSGVAFGAAHSPAGGAGVLAGFGCFSRWDLRRRVAAEQRRAAAVHPDPAWSDPRQHPVHPLFYAATMVPGALEVLRGDNTALTAHLCAPKA